MSRCLHRHDDDDCAMFSCTAECAFEYLKLYHKERGIEVMAEHPRMSLKSVSDVNSRFWRNDLRVGRSIYVLLSNDVGAPSDADPLIGVMETSTLAEDVVNSHNGLLERYGRRYPERIAKEIPPEVSPPTIERLRGGKVAG